MFHYLRGIVEEIGQNCIILDVGGIGFYINTSLKTLSSAAQGKEMKIYISESIGESNFDLFGFAEQQEKRFFELLITVSGVGPKAAISLLSSMNTDAMILAVLNDDAKALTAAPGIGKKIAQRIILELRDKLGAEVSDYSAAAAEKTAAPGSTGSGALADAVAALNVLGYSSAELSPILRSKDWNGMSADQIIRSVLKNMI